MIDQLDTSAIPPTAQVIPVSSVMRDDVARPSLPVEDKNLGKGEWTGSAEIELGAERNTMTAPLSAVFSEEGGSYVFVQGLEGWIKKKVELGLPNFTTVAIKSGVQKGDVIALQRPM